MRISKDEYYLEIAKTVALRGTCIRRNYGSVIVKNDRIISTGYTGAPRGAENCCDTGKCMREELNIPRGTRYELCKSVHSEQNAIINGNPADMIGATLYLTGIDNMGNIMTNADSCSLCKRMIINAQIKEIVVIRENGLLHINVKDWIKNGSLNQEGY